jgi:hypothetical protein
VEFASVHITTYSWNSLLEFILAVTHLTIYSLKIFLKKFKYQFRQPNPTTPFAWMEKINK